MDFSKIFLSLSSFKKLQNKFATQENIDEKKIKKNKKIDLNQSSFFFEDYIETSKKINFHKKIMLP